jgi:hypothetical protein
MTADAKKRLILHQQVIGNGSVRIMTDAAVLNHRGMLIDKRPLIFRMTFKAQVIYSILAQIVIFCAVNIMAASTGQLSLVDRVMGGQGSLGFFVLVTGKAYCRVTEVHHFGRRDLVRLVAFIAANAVLDMHVCPPVHGGRAGMALQTDFRALLGR